MREINEILKILNPWWQDNSISEELAKPYKRKIFNRLSGMFDYRQIIILTGLRRVGKTTLLYQIIELLLKKTDAKHILYFNFDKKVDEIIKILDSYEELTNTGWKKKKIFIFIDEIAKLDGWADKIKLIYDAFPNIKFVISSSSSVALEKEAIKNLAGRYFLINIQPLSFTEFLELKKKEGYAKNPELWEKEIKKELRLYLLRSFPEIIEWQDEYLIKDYLRTTIIDKIIKDDLPEKFRNVNKDLLLNLLEIFYSEPGMYLDYDSMSKTLRISKKTLLQHIFFLEFSYLLRRVRNFRPSIFAVSRKMQRAYANWWTMACCYTDNYDKIMENIVASSIDAKYYWRKNGKEIDFLTIDKKKIIPIEVKNKEKVTKTDMKNMGYFLKKYKLKEGLVIYNGEEDKIKIDNKSEIKLVPLWKWLLSM